MVAIAPTIVKNPTIIENIGICPPWKNNFPARAICTTPTFYFAFARWQKKATVFLTANCISTKYLKQETVGFHEDYYITFNKSCQISVN